MRNTRLSNSTSKNPWNSMHTNGGDKTVSLHDTVLILNIICIPHHGVSLQSRSSGVSWVLSDQLRGFCLRTYCHDWEAGIGCSQGAAFQNLVRSFSFRLYCNHFSPIVAIIGWWGIKREATCSIIGTSISGKEHRAEFSISFVFKDCDWWSALYHARWWWYRF